MPVAEFLILQHISDPFRREGQNVGVIVRMDDQISAKFFGEESAGIIDKRKIRTLPFPGPYAQWIRYWRRALLKGADKAWCEIKDTAKQNYQAIDGGTVDHIGSDNISEVVSYLYSMIVSEGGIAEALGAANEEVAVIRLADAIEDELRNRHVFGEPQPILQDKIKHPVRRDMPIRGAAALHTMTFIQSNGHPKVMEPIDLGVRRDKLRLRERAGWAAFAFEDIRAQNPKAETIALISATSDEEKQDIPSYALSMIRDGATDIVNWQSDEDRKRFLASCVTTATGD
jgi:hypothetical protein